MTRALLTKIKGKKFPIIVERDESGFYVVECPVFRGCFTQGKTIDEALKNIKEVIELCLEKIGYFVVRQRGSHIRMHNENRWPITIPNHKVLGKGLLRKILRDAELTTEEFLKLLEK